MQEDLSQNIYLSLIKKQTNKPSYGDSEMIN